MSEIDFRPTRLVSGGQTGVDRGALIAAALQGFDHGGYCPLNRRAEDGQIPPEFPMEESESPDYLVRTRLNVQHSDATLVMTYEDEHRLTGGTRRTVEFCRAFENPFFVLSLEPGADKGWNLSAAKAVRAWLRFLEPQVLNVAGPRESKAPGIQNQACEVVLFTLQTKARCLCGRETPAWVWERAEKAAQPVRCSQCGHTSYRSDFE